MAKQYRWADFVLDLDAYRLEQRGEPLALEPKALDLLALLVARPAQLVTKQQIFDSIWPGTAVTDHALTRVVAQLRRVLGDEAREAKFIETVPTRGYRWVHPVEAGDATRRATSPSIESPPPRTLVGGVVAALALAVVVVVIFAWTERRTSTFTAGSLANDPERVRWPVQLTTHAGLDFNPAMSPQGDAIAYVSDQTGAPEVYIRVLQGSATDIPLTADGGHNLQPAWSPDGRLIAYHSYRRGGIWVIPSRGGIAKQLVEAGSRPAWSPDGQRIAYQSDEHADFTPNAFGAQSGSTIWMVDADGHNMREITHAGHPVGGHGAPAWSHDGKHLAFTVFDGGSDNGAWLHTLETGETKRVDGGHGAYELAFAPDDSILYAAGGDALIVRLPIDRASGAPTGPREVIPVPGVPGVRGLSLSADGRQVAFAGLALSSQIWAQPIDSTGKPRSAPYALTNDTSRRNSVPVVSPDGSKVAYLSMRGGEPPNLWVVDAAGGRGMQVSSNDKAKIRAKWFPAGDRLALVVPDEKGPALYAVSIATRREELLFSSDRLKLSPQSRIDGQLAEFDLSPSMRSAAFSVRTPPAGRRTLFVSPLDAFLPRALTDGTMSTGYPAWSPDERRIAVEIKDGVSTHAGIIDVTTGAMRRLTNERGQTWVRSWSPDGRQIAVAALRDAIWSLRRIDVESGESAIITGPTESRVYLRYPDWSARGDLVVFERGELRGNVWMMALN